MNMQYELTLPFSIARISRLLNKYLSQDNYTYYRILPAGTSKFKKTRLSLTKDIHVTTSTTRVVGYKDPL
eukprot:SAG11_NODE_2329_length_3511_cov_58.602286_4_plen_70_part_00